MRAGKMKLSEIKLWLRQKGSEETARNTFLKTVSLEAQKFEILLKELCGAICERVLYIL